MTDDVEEVGTELSVAQLKAVVGPQHKRHVTQTLVDRLNNIATDPHTAEMLRENILGFTEVLRQGKFTLDNYISAVKYVSYLSMGSSTYKAYIKTFPERYQALIDDDRTKEQITSFVQAYNKNKLVNLVREQALIPTHILNADIYQKAINVQADLMLNAKSEKVRSDAANSLLSHLKRPEAAKVELNIGVNEGGAIQELRNITAQLAAKQRQLIEGGMYSATEIAHTKLTIEGEAEYVE